VPIVPPLRRLLDAHLAIPGITHGLPFPSRTQPGRALDKRATHRREQGSRSSAWTSCARTMHATASAESSQDDLADLSRADLVRLIGDLRSS
jgi:hypothetical protein